MVGGYLVLQEGVPGLVVSTSSRFHSSVLARPASAASAASAAPAGTLPVLIESPQFKEAWAYALSLAPPHALSPLLRKADGRPKRNAYAEFAVETALCAAAGGRPKDGSAPPLAAALAALAAAGQELHIVVRADNEFYSQRAHLTAARQPVSLAALAALPPFLPCPDAPDGSGGVVVNKTGLGSSAALVTSLSAATLAFFGAVSLPGLPPRVGGEGGAELVHTVAQIAHGLAQGKVRAHCDGCRRGAAGWASALRAAALPSHLSHSSLPHFPHPPSPTTPHHTRRSARALTCVPPRTAPSASPASRPPCSAG